MACGGCGKRTQIMQYPQNGEPNKHHNGVTDIGEFVMLDRKLCPQCTFKHLAYAYVALEESEHGYPDHIVLAQNALIDAGISLSVSKGNLKKLLSSKTRAVGHLVHAMEECPDRGLAKKIRKAYTAILDGEDHEDILNLIEELHENTPVD